MLSLLSQSVKDASVLRRLEFAAAYLPQDMPSYSECVAAFALKGKEDRNSLNPDQVLTVIQNMQFMDSGALISDVELTKEIIMMKRTGSDAPLGIVLLSNKKNCSICESPLKVRADRTSVVTIYDDSLGTVPATHYTKYCRKRGCSFQQHYNFSTQGGSAEVTYNLDWFSLPYFMSSRETAFAVEMLKRLDSEILFGQISYKQRADIYNYIHW